MKDRGRATVGLVTRFKVVIATKARKYGHHSHDSFTHRSVDRTSGTLPQLRELNDHEADVATLTEMSRSAGGSSSDPSSGSRESGHTVPNRPLTSPRCRFLVSSPDQP